MQLLAAARVLMFGGLVACLPNARDAYKSDVDRTFLVAPTPERQVAAVGPLAPQPWKVGQWATYRFSDRGYETIRVAAIDVCGTWISDEITTDDVRMRELLCLRTPDPDVTPSTDLVQMMILQVDDRTVSVIDFSVRDNRKVSELRASRGLRELVERLAPASWRGDTSSRETIDVPAGHFEMAVRTAESIGKLGVTRWAHPDVPFASTVWTKRADSTTYVLLAYGQTGARSMIPDIAAPAEVEAARSGELSVRPKFRDYFAIGGVSSWFTGLAGESSTSADGLEAQDGIAMTSRLDLVAGFAWGQLAHYSPDPTLHEQTMRFTLGFHYRPFATDARPAGVSLENLYVLADLGYARLSRGMDSNMDVVTEGFVGGAGVGWTWHATRGLGLSFEASDHALFFHNDDITAHNLAVSVLADLYLWYRNH